MASAKESSRTLARELATESCHAQINHSLLAAQPALVSRVLLCRPTARLGVPSSSASPNGQAGFSFSLWKDLEESSKPTSLVDSKLGSESCFAQISARISAIQLQLREICFNARVIASSTTWRDNNNPTTQPTADNNSMTHAIQLTS
jgi:hypothetical protein